jgi:hypothetical protein
VGTIDRDRLDGHRSQGGERRLNSTKRLWSGMKWREIRDRFRGGRGGRDRRASRVSLTLYYFGGRRRRCWKTTDGGANWKPMFDKQHSTSSIGALAVAPSDHNTIYAGCG